MVNEYDSIKHLANKLCIRTNQFDDALLKSHIRSLRLLFNSYFKNSSIIQLIKINPEALFH
jgi:hypothetical protein